MPQQGQMPQPQGPRVAPEVLQAAQKIDDELAKLPLTRIEHNELAGALRILVMKVEEQGIRIGELEKLIPENDTKK